MSAFLDAPASKRRRLDSDVENKAASASLHASASQHRRFDSASLDAEERIFEDILEDQEAMFVCAARCRKALDKIERAVSDDLLQTYGVHIVRKERPYENAHFEW